MLLLSHFSGVRLCATPETAAHQAPPSLGFSRQEHGSGLPFPSPTHESKKWKGSCSVVSDSSRPHGLQPTRFLRPWDFPGMSTGVGCHFLLQCVKVKSEREVAQSYLTLRDPMDCSPPKWYEYKFQWKFQIWWYKKKNISFTSIFPNTLIFMTITFKLQQNIYCM